jgi:exosortase A-associated hydrolase 1
MYFSDSAQSFLCNGDQLYGVLSLPLRPAQRGVVVVVGGPQYRSGSHRQFTLLARALATRGIAVLRFDYRGMGDSEGDQRDFEHVGDDVSAAIAHFLRTVPAVREVVLWGLCDGATAALLHACEDRRVGGLVLLNPWVRSSASAANTTLKHYYRQRLLQAAFWRKLLSGGINTLASWHSLRQLRRQRLVDDDSAPGEALPERVQLAWSRYAGEVLLILSGNDLVAREFAMLSATAAWRHLQQAPRVTRREIAVADHTFSRAAWRDQVAAWTADWVLRC